MNQEGPSLIMRSVSGKSVSSHRNSEEIYGSASYREVGCGMSNRDTDGKQLGVTRTTIVEGLDIHIQRRRSLKQEDNCTAFDELPLIEGTSEAIEGPPQRNRQGYIYRDLPNDCIRLLKILPDEKSSAVHCELREFVLTSELKYVALSYTWGRGPDVDKIMINDYEVRIRRNLLRFLHQARASHLDRFQWLWIDALCINQNDNRERMHQVDLMAQIYQAASIVIVWLGPSYNGSDVAFAHFNRTIHRGHADMVRKMSAGKSSGLYIAALCYRPYWRRLWILQETFLAKQLLLMCGARISPWQPFRDLLLEAREYDRDAMLTLPKHSRLAGGLELTFIPKSPAMFVVDLTWKQDNKQILHDLLFETTSLKCADPRDKVYALLGIAAQSHSDIRPDYDVMMPDLLNAVLRNYHQHLPPKDLNNVISHCHALERIFELEQSAMLSMTGRRTDMHTSNTIIGPELHFGLPNSPITWWWISFYRHVLIEDTFWSEFEPHILRFYYEAAGGGDIPALSVLFDRAKFDVDFTQNDERPLAHAARNGHAKAVHMLLRKGAGVNAINHGASEFLNALCGAVAGGYYTIVQALIDAGADVNAMRRSYPEHDLPLIQAAKHGHLDIAELLLDNGADISKSNVLATASIAGHTQLVEHFMNELDQERGYYHGFRSISKIFSTTLTKLCEKRNLQALVVLLSASTLSLVPEASVILTREMVLAAKAAQWEVVKVLLEFGADVNHKSFYNDVGAYEVLLHRATRFGQRDLVEVLLEAGANVRATCEYRRDDDYGSKETKTALMIARERSYTRIAELILANMQAHPEGGGGLDKDDAKSGSSIRSTKVFRIWRKLSVRTQRSHSPARITMRKLVRR
jgi:ankyrin repeat protein